MGQSVSRTAAIFNPFNLFNTVQPGSDVNFVRGEDVRTRQAHTVGAQGSYFGEHFLMGGERYDVAKPDTYLFGDNYDLELLGNKPVKFPYNLNKGVADTVNVLNGLVNIRRDSVKFMKSENSRSTSSAYKLEVIFDCDVPCFIQIHFCAKEVVDNEYVQIVSKYPSIDSSQKYFFQAGSNQVFDKYAFKAHRYDLKMMHYEGGHYFPVVIEIRTVEDSGKFGEQVQTTLCSIERSADQSSTLVIKPLKQKLIVHGVTYLLQEIFGIENKETDSQGMDENGGECIICMANSRDTVILPCRHLCICNGCAETLRYKLNNCPICRSPFKALLKLKAVHTVNSLNASGGSRLRQEALSLTEALNGPDHNGEHRKMSVTLCCKDIEGGKDIISTPVTQQRGSLRSLGLVERVKLKESQSSSRNVLAEPCHPESIELEHIEPLHKKMSDSSVVRLSGNSITRTHPGGRSIAGTSQQSSFRSCRTTGGSMSGSVESERLPLSRDTTESVPKNIPSTTSEVESETANENNELDTSIKHSRQRSTQHSKSVSADNEQHHATLVRVESQQSGSAFGVQPNPKK
ncbi:zinc finger, c3HC4 type (RING finger) domain-containing protein [Ditylenchus destructor]|uniref:RING-type E3 ubiquitin transferase n=1 Tax=Ditylenchus destructor TaxID=166010 RepID=A0AAD4N4G5_9BILA|nr:zinc finger, c3HC4 type (RING finger) domain-containing protein [Ditylenchus destructor]